ncbi:RidA family protein [Aquamicrobium ahrensii]|uniref:Enamine deaminase RidA (YjgF/YER057c/UK114 family) n=1 Tax=Aquamicrobium ahrensii TaxID=469551 RepID=A0ABV2KNX6_9HYPH
MSDDIGRIDQNHRRSRAVVHNGLVFTAGQIPDDLSQDIMGQAGQVLAKIDSLLREAGTDKSRVLSAQVWLRTIDDLAGMNVVWDAWVVQGRTPARICGRVEMNNPACRIEVQVIAAV